MSKILVTQDDRDRWLSSYLSSISAIVRTGLQFGISPIPAIETAVSTGFIGCDAGGWYSIGTNYDGVHGEQVFAAIARRDGKTAEDDWFNSPLLDSDSDEFLELLKSDEVKQITAILEQNAVGQSVMEL